MAILLCKGRFEVVVQDINRPRAEWHLTFRTPSDTDPRIFQGAFLAQPCPAVLCFRRMRGDELSAFPPGE